MVIITLLFGLLAVAPPGDTLSAPWNTRLPVLLVLLWLTSPGMLLPVCVGLAGRYTRRWIGRHRAQGLLIGDNLQRDRGRVMLNLLTLAVGLAMITGITGFMTFAFNDLLGDGIRRIAAEGTWAVFPFDLDRGLAGLSGMDELMLTDEAIENVYDHVRLCRSAA